MRIMKKLLSVLLAALICIACLVFSSSAGYKLGDTFAFGSYPQTRVTNSATLSELNKKATSWTSLKLYSGSGSFNTAHEGSFTKYCDVTYAGQKYRGITFTAYRPNETIYSTSTESNPGSMYQQYSNGYRINTTYWFKYEPLQWRVLDPSTGLILCLSAIDAQPFNNEVDAIDKTYYNRNNSTQYYACDYTHSSLRTWLNETFYNTAFTSGEQSKIVPTTVHNKGLLTLTGFTTHPELDFADSTEKVFLPAYDEMIDTSKGYKEYPGDKDPLRVRKATDYAKCLGIGIVNGVGPYWRMRTAGKDTVEALCVHFNGTSTRADRLVACSTTYGIVPMLCCSDVKTSVPTNVTVTFNPNGGSVSPTSKSVTVGGTYGDLPTPTRSGWTFDGWYDGSTKITASSTVTRTEAHTLLANWKSSGTTVTVTFNPNGGSVSPTSKSVTLGLAYGTLPTPSRFGFEFVGWYDGTALITASTTVTRTTAHTLNAAWQGAQETVYFNANGGSVSPASKTVRFNEPYGSLPTPTRPNCTFLGWFTFDESIVTSSTIVTAISSHSLIAHWVDSSMMPTIEIENYRDSRKVDYRTTITFKAQTTHDLPGTEVQWFINGNYAATGKSYTESKATKNFTVQAKLMLGDTPIASSKTETVKVDSGFFARLIAFFRNLFHSLPVITQEYLGIEYRE